MQYVPVRPCTEDDIEFAVRKRQTVMAEEISAGGKLTSLRNQSSSNLSKFCCFHFLMSSISTYKLDTMIPRSVLSHPIDVSHGNTKASLDYFTEEAIGISFRSHLRSQLLRLKELSEPEKDVIFSVNIGIKAFSCHFSAKGLKDPVLFIA